MSNVHESMASGEVHESWNFKDSLRDDNAHGVLIGEMDSLELSYNGRQSTKQSKLVAPSYAGSPSRKRTDARDRRSGVAASSTRRKAGESGGVGANGRKTNGRKTVQGDGRWKVTVRMQGAGASPASPAYGTLFQHPPPPPPPVVFVRPVEHLRPFPEIREIRHHHHHHRHNHHYHHDNHTHQCAPREHCVEEICPHLFQHPEIPHPCCSSTDCCCIY